MLHIILPIDIVVHAVETRRHLERLRDANHSLLSVRWLLEVLVVDGLKMPNYAIDRQRAK